MFPLGISQGVNSGLQTVNIVTQIKAKFTTVKVKASLGRPALKVKLSTVKVKATFRCK